MPKPDKKTEKTVYEHLKNLQYNKKYDEIIDYIINARSAETLNDSVLTGISKYLDRLERNLLPETKKEYLGIMKAARKRQAQYLAKGGIEFDKTVKEIEEHKIDELLFIPEDKKVINAAASSYLQKKSKIFRKAKMMDMLCQELGNMRVYGNREFDKEIKAAHTKILVSAQSNQKLVPKEKLDQYYALFFQVRPDEYEAETGFMFGSSKEKPLLLGFSAETEEVYEAIVNNSLGELREKASNNQLKMIETAEKRLKESNNPDKLKELLRSQILESNNYKLKIIHEKEKMIPELDNAYQSLLSELPDKDSKYGEPYDKLLGKIREGIKNFHDAVPEASKNNWSEIEEPGDSVRSALREIGRSKVPKNNPAAKKLIEDVKRIIPGIENVYNKILTNDREIFEKEGTIEKTREKYKKKIKKFLPSGIDVDQYLDKKQTEWNKEANILQETKKDQFSSAESKIGNNEISHDSEKTKKTEKKKSDPVKSKNLEEVESISEHRGITNTEVKESAEEIAAFSEEAEIETENSKLAADLNDAKEKIGFEKNLIGRTKNTRFRKLTEALIADLSQKNDSNSSDSNKESKEIVSNEKRVEKLFELREFALHHPKDPMAKKVLQIVNKHLSNKINSRTIAEIETKAELDKIVHVKKEEFVGKKSITRMLADNSMSVGSAFSKESLEKSDFEKAKENAKMYFARHLALGVVNRVVRDMENDGRSRIHENNGFYNQDERFDIGTSQAQKDMLSEKNLKEAELQISEREDFKLMFSECNNKEQLGKLMECCQVGNDNKALSKLFEYTKKVNKKYENENKHMALENSKNVNKKEPVKKQIGKN